MRNSLSLRRLSWYPRRTFVAHRLRLGRNSQLDVCRSSEIPGSSLAKRQDLLLPLRRSKAQQAASRCVRLENPESRFLAQKKHKTPKPLGKSTGSRTLRKKKEKFERENVNGLEPVAATDSCELRETDIRLSMWINLKSDKQAALPLTSVKKAVSEDLPA